MTLRKFNNLLQLFRKTCLFEYTVKNYARFIPNDKVVTLDSSTLNGRLMLYLKPDVNETSKTENFNLDKLLNVIRHKKPEQVQISNPNLINLIHSLEDESLIKSNREFYRILKLVDNVCFVRQEKEPKQILSLLDAYMELIPHRITELKFYLWGIDQLFSKIEELKDKDFMKFLFYVSLMKKTVKCQKILRKCLSLMKQEDIKELSSEDLCIIANSTFKTSTRINNIKILQKMKNYLNDNLMILRDPAMFVTLIKALRFNRYCDEDLLATISCAIFFNKSFELYTFQTYCHLLALYSDNLYYDKKLLQFISSKCMEEIKNYSHRDTGSKKIRSKDLVRFLWGMSNLNSTFFKADDYDVIVSRIIGFFETSQMSFDEMLIMFWYLWMLNHRCHRLVPYILDNKRLINELSERSSTRQKLNQLLVCIYHEDRTLYNQLQIKPQGKPNFVLEQHLKDRPCLQNVFRALNTIRKRRKLKFEIGYQIPHMYILGITGYTNNIYKTVHVEVLDNFTTLSNSDCRPTGLMQTKLRILDASEEALIVVKQNEIDDFTEVKLEEYLEDELNLVC